MKKTFLLFILGTILTAEAAPKGPPPMISVAGNKLIYGKDERGNRVPDFSTAGYAGGDRDIPSAPVKVVVSASHGDETANIQKAIDYVANLPADADGIRGAVLLLKGQHEVSGALHLTNSGVVLRGQGMEKNGTILLAAGLDRRTLITIHGQNDRKTQSNAGWQITDDYVPVGSVSFHVKDGSGLKAGDTVAITRPSTKDWIDSLAANDFGGGEGGGWKPGSRDLVWDRVVKSVDGFLVTLDAPITTALDANFDGGNVKTYSWPGRIQNIGVENLRLVSSVDPSNGKDENHSWMAITVENAQDAWVRGALLPVRWLGH